MAPPTDRDVLPDAIKPINYDLSLYNLELGGNWGYDGTVKIDSKVNSETQELVLSAKEIEITGADVLSKDGGSSITSMADVSYDKKSERATIKFSGKIPSGHAVIAVKFKGVMSEAMEGFYRSKYKPAVTPAAGTPKQGEAPLHVQHSI